MEFHLLNLVSNNSYIYNLYNQTSCCDIAEHAGKIYFCRGNSGFSLNASWCLDLSHYWNAEVMQINNLNEPRNDSSLIYTPFGLYIISGFNSNGKMNSCEKLEQSGSWKRIANLHTS